MLLDYQHLVSEVLNKIDELSSVNTSRRKWKIFSKVTLVFKSNSQNFVDFHFDTIVCHLIVVFIVCVCAYMYCTRIIAAVVHNKR